MKRCLLTVILTTFGGAVLADVPATQPRKDATSTTTAPTADPAAVKILDTQETAARKYATLKANLEYTDENPVLGDKEKRIGWVAYQRETEKSSAKIRIRFDTVALEDGPRAWEKLDYAFDGEWGIRAVHKTRNMTRYQVAPPGKKIPAMKLGEGPLPPLPFGQKTADVLEFFEAETRAPRPSDPKNTDYLKLTTRRRYRKELAFRGMEIWWDRKTHLPVRIVGKHRNKSIQTIVLKDFKINPKLKDKIFDLPTRGWKVTIVPYED